MTIDLLQTVRRALDEKWEKPEVLGYAEGER
jgi:hypothetical protein